MKLMSIMQLRSISSKLRKEGRKIVHCHGCFDFLHVGHLRHLQEARKYGDILIVTVTADRFVGKGPCRPIFNHFDRADMLAALQCVDYVAINDWINSVAALNAIKPDYYIKGNDYTDVECYEFQAAKKLGAQVFVTSPGKYSTTQLLVKLRA